MLQVNYYKGKNQYSIAAVSGRLQEANRLLFFIITVCKSVSYDESRKKGEKYSSLLCFYNKRESCKMPSVN